MSKQQYRIRNWHHYNEALIHRGSLTVWFDEKAISQWYESTPSGKRGRSNIYADLAIECMSVLMSVFHLPLRATQGLVASLIELLQLDIQSPHYSTLSRRQSGLAVQLKAQRPTGHCHVVVDATGLKVYGEGEWKVRQHGYSKRRTWRKLHLAADSESHSILACVVTTHDIHDGEVMDDLLSQTDADIKQVSADGAYDKQACYDSIERHHAKAVIPPRRDARIKQHGNKQAPPLQRDENLRQIRREGRKQWKINQDYHRRSLAETAIFRFKTLFGEHLQAHLFEHQATECFIKCQVLNRMSALGMPDSYAVG